MKSLTAAMTCDRSLALSLTSIARTRFSCWLMSLLRTSDPGATGWPSSVTVKLLAVSPTSGRPLLPLTVRLVLTVGKFLLSTPVIAMPGPAASGVPLTAGVAVGVAAAGAPAWAPAPGVCARAVAANGKPTLRQSSPAKRRAPHLAIGRASGRSIGPDPLHPILLPAYWVTTRSL